MAHEWTEEGRTVLVLRGHCRIAQGDVVAQANKMVLWHRTEKVSRATSDVVEVYLEDDVRIDAPDQSRNAQSIFFVRDTREGVGFDIRQRLQVEPATQDALYERAHSRRKDNKRNALLQTQLVVEDEGEQGPDFQVMPLQPPNSALRRVRIFPRNAIPYSIHGFKSEKTTPEEQVWVLNGGIRIVIDGLQVESLPDVGTVDLAADRMVIWTQPLDSGGFNADPGETFQSSDTPFTVYLEGNIIIRQGQNVVYATRATYDVREHRALYENVELRTNVPQINSDLRIKAERIRQKSMSSFHAQNAWATGSQYGVPGYRLHSSDIFLENRYTQPWIGSGARQYDPATGQPIIEESRWITSLNNTFLVEEVPLFYTPYLSAPADDPGVPLRRFTAGYDRVFGGQVRSTWDMFKLLGLDAPENTRWDLRADFYSERGPGLGTGGDYRGSDIWGIPGDYKGEGELFYVHDDGDDNLGLDRRDLYPEEGPERFRALWRHRQEISGGPTVTGEIGVLSDRNFLEQYYEKDFDRDKDVETLLNAQQTYDNWTWAALGRPIVNDFETTTGWLPRGDLYGLSEPLLGGWLTWSSHTSAGYGQLHVGDTPDNPKDIYTPLPYVADVEGAVLMTRHELNLPLNFGPVNVVPYAMGEGAFWSADFNGDSIERLVGNVGVRSSLMMSRIFPYIQSRAFNLNGLAHKILFEVDYSLTDSTQPLSAIPQYNEIDDNAQERFRNRFVTNTFNGNLPATFDPRFYAVRTGAGLDVTSPYHELVDDQQVVRFAVRQRLQTKEGPPDRLRTKDWMTLDLESAFFPNADRDNFGEDFGLLGARYRWNVGSRTSILANAYYDLFDDAQQLWNFGILSQRSRRGSLYLGLRQVKGAGLDSQIATASYTYQMSEKWYSMFGNSYDIAEGRNIGQSLTITRAGESFLFHIGANYDQSKGNAGIGIAVEPRFLGAKNSSTRLSGLLGDQVPTNR